MFLYHGDPDKLFDKKRIRFTKKMKKFRKEVEHQTDKKLNAHYLNDKITKLECLVSVLLEHIVTKDPKGTEHLLTNFGHLFLHQSTLWEVSKKIKKSQEDDTEEENIQERLKTKEKEIKKLEKPVNIMNTIFGDNFISQD